MSYSDPTRVTVLLAVYNGMPHLRHAIESIQCQTLSKFKVLVFDDGSTDGTAAYLDQVNDKRFHIVHQENVGLAVTLNRMIDLVETEFIARMDADDVCMPKRFEKQLNFLEQHPEVAVVGTRAGYVKGERSVASFKIARKIITLSYAPPTSNPPYWNPVADQQILNHSSVMMRTKELKELGGYPNMVPGQDLALWHRFHQSGRMLANIDEILILLRITKSGISGSNLARQYHSWCYTGYHSKCTLSGETPLSLEDYARTHPLPPQQLRFLEAKAALRNAMADILAGKWFAGTAGLMVAFVRCPSLVLSKLRRRLNRS